MVRGVVSLVDRHRPAAGQLGAALQADGGRVGRVGQVGQVGRAGQVGRVGAMRVIAGSLKGRRLKPPTWDGLRPTSDKLRETLFNILAPRIAGARVLDAYAGTGAAGIEALSRGATAVTFVERDRRAQALIADNLAHCGVADGYAIIRASVARALSGLRMAGASFDIA